MAIRKQGTKAQNMARSPSKDKPTSAAAGAATAAGMNFQAAVTAITGVHLLLGRPLEWLDGVAADVPTAVWAETGGPGDDIRLELANGDAIEVQVKKGLQRGAELWDSLLALARAIASQSVSCGVLAVSVTSSGTIREELANDVRRIGDGRTDHLHDISLEFLTRLKDAGLSPQYVCARMRVPTVHALADDSVHVLTAKTMLANLCPYQEELAWNRLYREAEYITERRGRWTLESLSRVLSAANIQVPGSSNSAYGILRRLVAWNLESNRKFSIAAYALTLPIQDAWLPLKAKRFEHWVSGQNRFDQVLQRYRDSGQRPAVNESEISMFDAEWTGFFQRRSLVFAGPGMGKSTLIARLAHRYATEGYAVLKVSLKRVAAQMERGESFFDSVLHLGLDGSGLLPEHVKRAGLREWVLLCDGLDETRSQQDTVAQAILQFAAGNPLSRIVVSSRPVGYATGHLAEWRHYELLQLDEDAGAENLRTLICAALPGNGMEETGKRVVAALNGSAAVIPLLRNPQLLSMAAALILNGAELGRTKVHLYKNLFKLLAKMRSARTGEIVVGSEVLDFVLDLLCWEIMCTPTAAPQDILRNCATSLMDELGEQRLRASVTVETCLQHWEQLGILEALHHGLDGAIAASHQTFAEFGAARRLASMPEQDRRTAIERYIDDPAWFEVFRFAAGLGLAGELLEAFLARADDDFSAIQRALAVLAESNTEVDTARLQMLLNRAKDMIAGPVSELTFPIGFALADICRVLPAAADSLSSLEESGQPWARGIVCLCLLEAGRSDTALDSVAMELKRLGVPGGASRYLRATQGTSMDHILPHDFEKRLVLSFVYKIVKYWPRPEVETYLNSLAHNPGLSVGLLFDIDSYVRTHGFRMSSPPTLDPGYVSRLFTPPENYVKAKLAELAILMGAARSDTNSEVIDPSAKPRALVFWRAFIQMTGMLECELSSTLAWLQPFNEEAVNEVIKGLLLLTDIDRGQLAADVAQLESLGKHSPYDLIPLMSLDVEPCWELASVLKLDRKKLEEALSHPSPWLVTVASNILATLPPPTVEHLALLLNKTSGWGLGGVGYLFKVHYPNDATEHIMARLEGRINQGLESLLLCLSELNPPWSDRLSKLIDRLIDEGYPKLVGSAEQFASNYMVNRLPFGKT